MNRGERIRFAREAAGMTQGELGLSCGTTKQTIFKYENGIVTNIPLERIERIAEVTGVTPTFLMGWDDISGLETVDNILPMPATYSVPRLGAIACGEPILAEENIEGYDQVPDYVKCDFTLLCKGDSMINARIYEGDIVCIRRQPTVENGQIAAVLIEGEYESEATLKRVRFQDNGIALWPENPQHETKFFTGEDVNKVRILGLATHFISAVR